MRRRNRCWSALVGTCLIGLCARPVGAQPSGPSETASAEADAFFRQGKEAFARKDMQASNDAYRKAWARKRSWDIATNLANTELVLGHYAEAANMFSWAIRSFPPTGTETSLAEIKKRFSKAEAQCGRLTITVSAVGATELEVRVDGKPIELPPQGAYYYVLPGAHKVEATAVDYDPAVKEIQAEKGAVVSVELAPTKKAKTAGRVGPAGPTGAQGPEAHGATGPVAATGPAGPSGASVSPEKTTVVLIGAGSTAVLTITGVVLAVVANSKAGAAEDQRRDLAQSNPEACGATTRPAGCTELEDTLSAKDDLGSAAFWTLMGAGVVGLGTVGYWLFAPDASDGATGVRRVVPVVGDHQGGLWIEGSF